MLSEYSRTSRTYIVELILEELKAWYKQRSCQNRFSQDRSRMLQVKNIVYTSFYLRTEH